MATLGNIQVDGASREVAIRTHAYPNGRLAVILRDDEEGVYGCLSINIPEIPLVEDEFIVSHDGFDEAEVVQLLALGFERTGRTASYGFVRDQPILRVPKEKAG